MASTCSAGSDPRTNYSGLIPCIFDKQTRAQIRLVLIPEGMLEIWYQIGAGIGNRCIRLKVFLSAVPLDDSLCLAQR